MSAPATLALVHRLTVYGLCPEDHGGCVVNKLVTGRDVSGQVDTCRNQSTDKAKKLCRSKDGLE
jgi:hypothetical protein